MDTVFVGSDETGYYRGPNATELRREVERLETKNERLMAALRSLADESNWDYANCGEHIPSGPCWVGEGHPVEIAAAGLSKEGEEDRGA